MNKGLTQGFSQDESKKFLLHTNKYKAFITNP